jgi:hypothetical protein
MRWFKEIKLGRLRWFGQPFRMQELDPCRKLTVLKPEGTRRVGIPKVRWIELVQEDLKKIGTGDVSSRIE